MEATRGVDAECMRALLEVGADVEVANQVSLSAAWVRYLDAYNDVFMCKCACLGLWRERWR